MLDKAAIYIGLRRSGTDIPTMVIPPENKADAPPPATALPTMSATEFGAEAQMIDPSSKTTSANM